MPEDRWNPEKIADISITTIILLVCGIIAVAVLGMIVSWAWNLLALVIAGGICWAIYRSVINSRKPE